LVAAMFVVTTLLIVGYLDFSTRSQLRALENERNQLKVEVEVLAKYIQDQRRLVQDQGELQKLLAVRNQLQEKYVPWSDSVNRVFTQFPFRRSGLALKTVGTKLLTSADLQAQQTAGNYDGKPISMEFSVQGEAISQAALIRFIDSYESSPNFGINFQQSALDESRGVYTFAATIGMVKNPGAVGGGDAR
jgi:type IV pilus assembly protein PilN